MDLICIAHRGEAQAFLKDFKAVEENLYQNEKALLVITGEGHWKAMEIGLVFGKYPIQRLINFGIAGALDKDLALEKIYCVRTVYSFAYDKPLFASFTSQSDSTVDCITAMERVLNDERAEQLACFAHLVDRELWALAYLANKMNIPFESYKLISDYAGSSTDCFDLKAKASDYSKQLYSFYHSLTMQQKPPSSKFEYPEVASFTQRKQIDKILKQGLSGQTYRERKTEFGSFQTKADVNKFIETLKQDSNPLRGKIIKKLETTLAPLQSPGLNIHYDQNLENHHLKLHFEINDQKNISDLIQALERFDYSAFKRIFEGHFDV